MLEHVCVVLGRRTSGHGQIVCKDFRLGVRLWENPYLNKHQSECALWRGVAVCV
jgi:hypothetical protein